jgi:hypothetical protein
MICASTGTSLAAFAPMASSKQRSIWPSDDKLQGLEGDREFTDDGRKVNESERVGGMAPDADPDRRAPRRPDRK